MSATFSFNHQILPEYFMWTVSGNERLKKIIKNSLMPKKEKKDDDKKES